LAWRNDQVCSQKAAAGLPVAAYIKKPPCLVNEGFSGDIRRNKKDNEKEVTAENS
jgi:hypothetical protein